MRLKLVLSALTRKENGEPSAAIRKNRGQDRPRRRELILPEPGPAQRRKNRRVRERRPERVPIGAVGRKRRPLHAKYDRISAASDISAEPPLLIVDQKRNCVTPVDASRSRVS